MIDTSASEKKGDVTPSVRILNYLRYDKTFDTFLSRRQELLRGILPEKYTISTVAGKQHYRKEGCGGCLLILGQEAVK
jgi:hypothetical protein